MARVRKEEHGKNNKSQMLADGGAGVGVGVSVAAAAIAISVFSVSRGKRRRDGRLCLYV